jgi:pimeloyl-ACP methyl ester carboxylesterase
MVPGRPQVLRHMVTPARYRNRSYVYNVAGAIYGGQMRSDPDRARMLLVEGDRPPSPRSYAYQLMAAAGWTSLPFLRLIRQQTLLLHGTDDPLIPLVNGRIMARLLPHARLHIYADGHLGLVTGASELAPVVSAFLLSH